MDVTITARNEHRGAEAANDIRAASASDSVAVASLDLARLASVREFAGEFLASHDRLDVLILNAGIMSATRQVTEDGFELMFQVNHLAHFLLTKLLLDRVVDSAPARIVVVASVAHKNAGPLNIDDLQAERKFTGLGVYAQSKLANVLFARELARRLEGTQVTVNSLHPGTVRTGWGMEGDSSGLLALGLKLARPFFLSPEQGAATTIHLALSPDVAEQTGGYYVRSKKVRPHRNALDDQAARRLWDLSEEMVAPFAD